MASKPTLNHREHVSKRYSVRGGLWTQAVAPFSLNLLEELRKSQGLSTVLITHDLAEARSLADRIVVLREGNVVGEGEADAVVSNPQHPYTRDLLNAVPERWQ